MGRIQRLIEDNTPEGTYVHSIQIGDTNLDDVVNGFFMPVNDQVLLQMQKFSISEVYSGKSWTDQFPLFF